MDANRGLLIALLLCCKVLLAVGWKCYKCGSLDSCGRVFNTTDVEQRRSQYSTDCSSEAEGCIHGIIFRDAKNTTIDQEMLDCYVKRAKPGLGMNACTEYGNESPRSEGKRVYCVCNKGDFCILGGRSRRSGDREDDSNNSGLSLHSSITFSGTKLVHCVTVISLLKSVMH